MLKKNSSTLATATILFSLFLPVNLAFAELSQGESKDQPRAAPTAHAPEEVTQDGAFRHRLFFDIPKYRGLEPSLGLTYRSSFKGRGSAETYLGIGWQLRGFSSIERVSLGGGTPTYDDSLDLFRLDGQELMACEDSEATNKLSLDRSYPERYQSEVKSASCLAGGNLTTQVESYQRIILETVAINGKAVEQFLISDGKGTTYTYQSLGTIAGEAATGADQEFNILFRRKFLLTKIENTQSQTSSVNYTYQFANKANGLAHRPATITYAGYKVEFKYSAPGEPMATYAIGSTDHMGRQYQRLESVSVFDSGNKIRGYQMQYETAAQTGANLLKEVEVFGNDFQRNAGIITSGTQLPNLLSAANYTPTLASLTSRSYPGEPFHRGAQVADVDDNGRDELLFTHPEGTPNQCHINQTASKSHFSFSGEQVLSEIPLPSHWTEMLPPLGYPGAPPISSSFSQLLPKTTNDTSLRVVTSFQQYIWERGDVYPSGPPKTALTEFDPNGPGVDEVSFWYTPGTYRFGNFDDDPEYEAIHLNSDNKIYFVPTLSAPWTSATLQNIGTRQASGTESMLRLDIDGDGAHELLLLPSWNPSGGWSGGLAGFTDPNLTNLQTQPGSVYGVDFRDRRAHHFATPPLESKYTRIIGNGDNPESDPLMAADVNGDGNQDLVYSASIATVTNSLYVALSTGNGFLPPVKWIDSSDLDNSGQRITSLDSATTTYIASVADVNGDGLDDVIVADPLQKSTFNCNDPGSEYQAYPLYGVSNGRIFLSTGTGFIPPEDSGLHEVPGYIETGDFDGNGLPDFASEGAAGGSILFGTGEIANLLTTFTTDTGAVTTVTYKPSTEENNNSLPYVAQLVDTISIDNGRGQSRNTSYSYVNAKYDYYNRRALGYQTITAHLPALAGEAEGPSVITTFLNSHLSERGLVKSQTRIQGGNTYSKVINDWSSIGTSGKGPFRVSKSSTRVKTRYGNQLIETRKTYSWTDFGAQRAVRDYGFTSGGRDLDPSDNVSTFFGYRENLASYLTRFPVQKRIKSGLFDDTDPTSWLYLETYRYQSNSHVWLPTSSPNLVERRVWNGVTTGSTTYDVSHTYEFDNYGNITKYTDPLSNPTSYTFDVNWGLFQLTETNAKGHVVTTTWDWGCQAPSSITDANGLVTTTTYDVHCREDYVSLPSGDYLDTSYVNLGDPQLQHIRKLSLSPSGLAGSATKETREYFDGFGQTYKVATTGETSAQADLITTVSGFDLRGNLSWQSIPLSWAAANAPITSSQGSNFKYDPLDRQTQVTQANGAVSKQEDLSSSRVTNGNTVHFPRIKLTNPNCYDGDPETVCQTEVHEFDARGNRLLVSRNDVEGTDVSGQTWPQTNYTYDLLDRLIGVQDPKGALWTYTYDTRGNRLTSDDPGLGYWTLKYDLNDNLIRQIDAKGQKIAFTYDVLNRETQKRVTRTDANHLAQKDITYTTYDQAHTWLGGGFNTGFVTTRKTPEHRISYTYNTQGSINIERHRDSVTSENFLIKNTYHASGALLSQELPVGHNARQTMPSFTYDAAGRLKSFGSYVTDVSYNLRSQPTWTTFGNGVKEEVQYDSARGWIDKIRVFQPNSTTSFHGRRTYTRADSGQVTRQWAGVAKSRFNYCYDYTGRLLVAADLTAAGKTCSTIGAWTGAASRDQFFSYHRDGSMASNSHLGSYTYTGSPVAHAPATVDGEAFTYDANGNMTTGLDGKQMSYDGENRPLSVTAANGDKTEYLYGADGTRIKRQETVAGQTTTSWYFGGVEIIQAPGAAKQVHLYPHANLRLTYEGGQLQADETRYMHRDQLDSVFVITKADGSKAARRDFAPFGLEAETISDLDMADYPAKEDFGFIGEREDEVAGLMYLNARYYDPELAMFIQPDWFEVTKPGVGTNRYSYSFNDPINKMDPSGNVGVFGGFVGAIAGIAVQGAIDVYNGELSSKGAYAGAAVAGAIAGATAGLGTGVAIAGGAAGGAAGVATDAVVDGENLSATDVAVGAAVGALGGAAGDLVGKTVSSTIDNLSPHAKGVLGESMTRAKSLAQGYVDRGKSSVPTGGKTPTGRDASAVYDHNMTNVFTGHTKTVESKFNGAVLSKNQRAAQKNVANDFEVSRTKSTDIGNAAAAETSGVAAGMSKDNDD